LFQRDRYVINGSLGVEVDVNLFEREVESGLRALRAKPGAPDAVARLRAALDLYRGDFLEDDAAGDWHLEFRDHLRRRWTDGLTALGSHLLVAGSHADAADVYRRLVRADEWDEAAHRQLMVALALSGQRGEALRHYDRLVALLHRELEAAPARETTAHNDRLRRGDFGD
jgi:DNA-binding SARP family transcriptional activator